MRYPILALSALLAIATMAVPITTSHAEEWSGSIPQFKEYPTHSVHRKQNATPILDDADKRNFRTRIREAARGKPSFAGRYTLAVWGCGTGCNSGAIVDLATGQVNMLPFTLVTQEFCGDESDLDDIGPDFRYQLDSALIVLIGKFENPQGSWQDPSQGKSGYHYFAYHKGDLRYIKTRGYGPCSPDSATSAATHNSPGVTEAAPTPTTSSAPPTLSSAIPPPQVEVGARSGASETVSTTALNPSSAPAISSMPISAPQNEIGVRVALVIGNSNYSSVSQLPNPSRDASTVAQTLRAAGFETVQVETDLGFDAMRRTLRDFASAAARADWAVVYFAGHGIEMAGQNYLIPVDARLKSDRDVSFEAIPLDQVLTSIEGAKKLRLVILDACRDNPFVQQMSRSLASRSVGRGLARVEPEGGTLVAYAAKHGQIALDGEGQNSPFVSALVKHINTPGVEIRRLFGLVRDDVLAATGKKQEPFVYGSLGGDEFFFRRLGAPTSRREPQSTPRITFPTMTLPPVPPPKQSEALLAQRAVFYEEDPANPQAPKAHVGRAVWHLEDVNPGQGQALEKAVSAQIEVPDAGLTMRLMLRRNLDTTLPASHTVELTFTTRAGENGRVIRDVGLLQFKNETAARGIPVKGLPVPVGENLFLIGLSNLQSDVERNTELFVRRNWIDLPVRMASGQRAILSFEKGAAGEQVLTQAVSVWLSPAPSPAPVVQQQDAPQDEAGRFAAAILGNTKDVWGLVLPSQTKRPYEQPKLVLYSNVTQSGCGSVQATQGPFYCTLDQTIYLADSYFQTILRSSKGKVDMVYSYVVARQVGLHIQNQIGILPRVLQRQSEASLLERVQLSLRTELMADCLAGIWTHHSQQEVKNAHQEDVIKAVIAAAEAIEGTPQHPSQGYVAATRGTSDQRVRWYSKGLKDGRVQACDTFRASQL